MENYFLIENVRARMILDSRGNPTIESKVYLKGRAVGKAAVPSGASRGKHEALELRDGGKEYGGKGVSKAVKNVNEVIAPKIKGLDARKQILIDSLMIELDGTPNKSRLGANAILSVSLAVARVASIQLGAPLYKYIGGIRARTLPTPMMNIINGGAHAGNELSIQEFMIVPVAGDAFSEALRVGVEVYHSLKKLLADRYGKQAINVGDEGGFAPPMKNTREALEALVLAIKNAGYEPGSDVFLALDAAASQFYSEGKYSIDGKELDKEEMIEYYSALIYEYPICSIEDPFYEEDFEGFAELTRRHGSRILIVGDDLYVTNRHRLLRGLERKSSNAILIKVNQIGTLSETLDTIELAQNNSMKTIVSHRSGETEDTFIADLSVAVNSGLIKTGAPARSERVAKYNRLLEIEEELGGEAIFASSRVFPRKRYV